VHHARTATIATVLLLSGSLFGAVGATRAAANYPGQVGVKQAHRLVHTAERDVERAKAALREARAIEDATRAASATYSPDVGRWVSLARREGWVWGTIPQLMYVIDRESGGAPKAKNPTSTATGLLQMLQAWWDGTWFGWVFDPTDPAAALHYGWKAYHDRGLGWQPWAL
jgi:hypothetical protein